MPDVPLVLQADVVQQFGVHDEETVEVSSSRGRCRQWDRQPLRRISRVAEIDAAEAFGDGGRLCQGLPAASSHSPSRNPLVFTTSASPSHLAASK